MRHCKGSMWAYRQGAAGQRASSFAVPGAIQRLQQSGPASTLESLWSNTACILQYYCTRQEIMESFLRPPGSCALARRAFAHQPHATPSHCPVRCPVCKLCGVHAARDAHRKDAWPCGCALECKNRLTRLRAQLPRVVSQQTVVTTFRPDCRTLLGTVPSQKFGFAELMPRCVVIANCINTFDMVLRYPGM